MSVYIETDRLILRDWQPEDLVPFSHLNADPMIMEYFPRTLNEKASAALASRFQDHFKQYGYGPYVLQLKSTGEFIGFTGLLHTTFDAPFTPAIEIAWRLDYAYWGKGYATEAGLAVLDHAFKKLGLEEIVAYAVHDNAGALRIMEKIGMKRDPAGDFHYPGLPEDHPLGSFVLYRIKKQDIE